MSADSPTELDALRSRLAAVERRVARLEDARTAGGGAREQGSAKQAFPRFTRDHAEPEDGASQAAREADAAARAAATRMLLAGRSRAEVARFLTESLGVRDAEAVLEQIAMPSA